MRWAAVRKVQFFSILNSRNLMFGPITHHSRYRFGLICQNRRLSSGQLYSQTPILVCNSNAKCDACHRVINSAKGGSLRALFVIREDRAGFEDVTSFEVSTIGRSGALKTIPH
jgi:hypothetical protein